LSVGYAAAAIRSAAGCGDRDMLTSFCRWRFGSLLIRRLVVFLSHQSAG
jgi:hypothetical protein